MTRVSIHIALTTTLAVFSVGLAGCLKVHDETTIAADGSGTLTEDVEINLAAMKDIEKMFKDMAKDMGGPPGGGPAMDGGAKPEAPKPEEKEPPKEDPLVKLKAEWKDIPGIEVTKATEDMKEDKATLHVEAKFTSLEAYAKASQIEAGCELVKNADGSYTLKFMTDEMMGGDAKPEAPAMDADGKPAGMDGDKPPDDPMGGMLAGLGPIFEKSLEGLEFSRKLTLPGTIVETNGTKGEDGSTVTWKITFADMKAAEAKKAKPEAQTVTFKGEGIDIKPFKVVRKSKEMGMGMGPGPGPGPMGK